MSTRAANIVNYFDIKPRHAALSICIAATREDNMSALLRGTTPYLSLASSPKISATQAELLKQPQHASHSPENIARYITKWQIPSVMEALSAILVMTRPERPYTFLVGLLEAVLTSERTELDGKALCTAMYQKTTGPRGVSVAGLTRQRRRSTSEESPRKNETRPPKTSMTANPEHYLSYLDQHCVKEVFLETVHALITAMPSRPLRGILAGPCISYINQFSAQRKQFLWDELHGWFR